MSEPEHGKGTLKDALLELGSASSSLHMFDDLSEHWEKLKKEGGLESDGEAPLPFLDEKYLWAKHCMEHIKMASDIILKLKQEDEKRKEDTRFEKAFGKRGWDI